MPNLVAAVARRLVPTPIPLPFHTVDMVVSFVFVLIETDIVENEELCFRSEVGRVRQPRQLHVVFCFAGNIARIFGIVLTRDGILNVAGHYQRLSHKRVNERGRGCWNNEHVTLVNSLPAREWKSRQN